jgi:ADP-heptose:LPS heptosyltransferase
MLRHLGLLGVFRGWLTVENAFGAPGDTLMAATVCRIIKERFPRLRINLITDWPDLVAHDPNLNAANAPVTYFTLRFWYLETIERREPETNLLHETLSKVLIRDYEYRASFVLTRQEQEAADQLLSSGGERPRLAFSTITKEKVKNWPEKNWRCLIESLQGLFDLIQIGDDREPHFEGVQRMAGKLSMRESIAVVSRCDLFVGGVSLLMHAANGLNVPSVIIYGGRETPQNSGYAENINLFVPMPCGPCWLHDSRGDVCPYAIACMDEISVDQVLASIREILLQKTTLLFDV